MRVLLVKPNSFTDSVIPPLGLGYLAESIRGGHEVDILNAQVRGLTLMDVCDLVSRWRPDVLGLQVYSSDRRVVQRYVRALAQQRPRPLLVLGGPHPSSTPETVLSEFGPAVECAFAGEAELSFRQWLDALELGARGAEAAREVPGLIYRDGERVVQNKPRFAEDLSRFGEPAWDLLRPEHYPHAPFAAFVTRFPVAPVIASRGCPYRCTFCAAGHLSGHRIRYRRPDSIVDEIKRLQRVHGIREVQFADDNLTADPRFVRELCEQMIGARLRIPWSCPNGVRVERLDRSLLSLMRRAGCHSLAVGIESGAARVLRKVRKESDLGRIRAALQAMRDEGIVSVGYFMLGFPGESDDERRQTIQLALDLPLDRAHFMLYCPLPGTPLFEEVASSSQFLGDVDYSFNSAIYVPEGTTRARLIQQQKEAFLRFYLRPRQLGLLLRSGRSPAHAWHLAGRIQRWLRSGLASGR